MLNNNKNKYNKPSQLIHRHRVLMKEFTPLGLHLLGPASMTWASVLAQYGKKNVVYKAL